MSAPVSLARQRLQALADACEELARRSPGDGELFHWVANQARTSVRYRLGDSELADKLAALAAIADLGEAYCLGEPSPYATRPVTAAMPPPAQSPLAAEGERGATLAERHGMTDRWAREQIKRAAQRGLPGFHRVGWEWRADPDAFAQFRVSSERPGRATPSL